MAFLWTRKYINEDRGGAPDTSEQGQILLRGKSFLRSVHRTYAEPRGVHPASPMDAGLVFGNTPHGVRHTSAVIPDTFSYKGILPTKLQPRVPKPEPYD